MRAAVLCLPIAIAGAVAAGAMAVPAPPRPPAGPASPPPAWIGTRGGDHWLAFSTYCWTVSRGPEPRGACADYVSPEQRDDLPRIVLTRGQPVRLHLGFTPKALTLTVGKQSFRLRASSSPAWRVRGRGGVVTLMALANAGDASYVARFVLRDPRP